MKDATGVLTEQWRRLKLLKVAFFKTVQAMGVTISRFFS